MFQMINPKILIIFSLLIGLATAFYAKNNNKKPYFWFAMGVFFGIWPLITLLLFKYISKRNQKKATLDPLSNNMLSNIYQKIKINDPNPWYYLNDNNTEIGPMSSTKLHSLYVTGYRIQFYIHMDRKI